MNTHHVEAYFKAMSGKETTKLAEHLAESVILLSPVFPDPFEGKDTVVKILSGLLATIDSIHIDLTFASGRDVAVFFTIECDGVTVKGNEHIHLDESGLIDFFEVAWRPLASAVLIQEKLANKLGGEPMRLVPATSRPR
ncbi:nuclear transport factor 2 family protein [Bradyrhizobium elkanii]|uniref:nuclear transport factor 2 family protein n=1 Tax=Bradyrhizobium elkanii TaxID=29448 RepID=UPI001BA96EEE|nr:nuclear transport factor 2 family protein [Bradyrhizobium elkanii]MBR1159420.1 nuclear transport factor 2 family protein [Bradyrhizobium elkanii]